jgi:hypothetical protein
MPTEHDLHDFMNQYTDLFAAEYKRIFRKTTQDPGTAGDEGEENWASLFKKIVPSHYHVKTKGRIVNNKGEYSRQADVVILKPSYPPGLLEHKVWLAAGVAAVFECKNTLKAIHISEAIRLCSEIKALYEVRAGSPEGELIAPVYVGLLAHSHSWKEAQSDPVKSIYAQYVSAKQKHVDHPRNLLDIICVADLAAWTSFIITKFEADWLQGSPSALQAKLQFQNDWGICSSMVCHSVDQENQNQNFTPIGSLVGHMTRRLARFDPSMRDIAEYYDEVDILGSASGEQFYWGVTSYSDDVKNLLNNGFRDSDRTNWSKWNLHF